MRILHLITHYVPHIFGAELFVKKIAEESTNHGHHVDIVTGLWNPKWSKNEIINGVNVHRVSVNKTRFIQTLLFAFPQLKYAQKLINQNDYDIIHAHIFPSLITGSLLKSKAKKIVTIQGGDLADYKEIFGPFEKPWFPLLKTCLTKYDVIHTVSKDLKRRVEMISQRSDSVVIPNGVDIFPKITSKEKKEFRIKYFPDTKYTLFSPSRLTAKNNLAETIKAISICRQEDLDIGLVIAGSGFEEKNLSQLINKLNFKKYIKLIGAVEHDLVQKLIQASDVLIRVPIKEGFGIALLEGLASNVPVISSQAGGLADFINHKNAYIPKSFKADSIAKSIQTLFNDPNKKVKKKNGLKLVEDKYTWLAVCNQIEKLYH